MPEAARLCNNPRTMSDRIRTALVTGSTGAIGQAIADGFAKLPNYALVAVGRDPLKVERLVAQLSATHRGARVRGEIVDVSSPRSVSEFAQRWEGPLDVLINNSAVAPPRREQTEDGIERVFATNVLGYLWMTKAFEPALRAGKDARVVNVTSYWAGDLDLNDLEFKRRRYDNDVAYRQSKQANRMLTVAWANRLAPSSIAVNCCHPGDVNSKLSNDLGFGGSSNPADGASAPLWLATSNEAQGKTGQYYEHGHLTICRFGTDTEAVERLAKICDGYFTQRG